MKKYYSVLIMSSAVHKGAVDDALVAEFATRVGTEDRITARRFLRKASGSTGKDKIDAAELRWREAQSWREKSGANDARKRFDGVPLAQMHTVTKDLSGPFLERFPWFIYGVRIKLFFLKS